MSEVREFYNECSEHKKAWIDLAKKQIDFQWVEQIMAEEQGKDFNQESVSDGSTASYYELPINSSELQHLISFRNMNAQMGEIFRSCYRYGLASHSDQLRDAKKIKYYIDAEIARLEKWGR